MPYCMRLRLVLLRLYLSLRCVSCVSCWVCLTLAVLLLSQSMFYLPSLMDPIIITGNSVFNDVHLWSGAGSATIPFLMSPGVTLTIVRLARPCDLFRLN